MRGGIIGVGVCENLHDHVLLNPTSFSGEPLHSRTGSGRLVGTEDTSLAPSGAREVVSLLGRLMPARLGTSTLPGGVRRHAGGSGGVVGASTLRFQKIAIKVKFAFDGVGGWA